MNSYRIEDLVAGTSASFKVTVTEEMMERFGDITGDRNPLHTDYDYAVVAGFSGRVSYAMLTGSFYSTLVGMYLPGKYALFHSLDAAFVQPVFAGDSLTVYGEVESVHRALRQAQIRAHITNQHGRKVSRAKIKSGILG
jgi:3-hydroxybutyryl-CoA dehydratase